MEETLAYFMTSEFFLRLLIFTIVSSMLVLVCFLCALFIHYIRQRKNKVIVLNENKDEKTNNGITEMTPSSRPFVVEDSS